MVIVLRGKKGVHKYKFAMQLMHGLARSLKQKKHSSKTKALYYSIDKTKNNLSDAYIDFLITEMHAFMIRESRMSQLFPGREEQTTLHEDCRKVYDFFFQQQEHETKNEYQTLNATRSEWLKKFDHKIVDFLIEYVLVYNPRTNSLHFRRPIMGDSDQNLWISRSYDLIEDYQNLLNSKFQSLKTGESAVAKHFREMFIDVQFNPHHNEDENNSYLDLTNMVRHSKKANMEYSDILTNMQDILTNMQDMLDKNIEKYEKLSRYEKCENEEHAVMDRNYQQDTKYDVLVIDGFSQLNEQDLESISFYHLHQVARKLATVTILVLDERSGNKCDGDLVIELRKSNVHKHSYLYHELQIVKSSFQDVANGWHQYKVQEEAIKVFPSIHFLLSKRYYLTHRSREIGQGLLEDSYEEYLDSLMHLYNEYPDEEYVVDAFKYDAYSCFRNINHESMFLKMLNRHLQWKSMMSSDFNSIRFNKNENNEYEHILSSILLDQSKKSLDINSQFDEDNIIIRQDIEEFREWPEKIKTDEIRNIILNQNKEVFGWNKRYPATVILGNPNSFKRRLAMAKAFHCAAKKEHVLIVIFGKNDDNLRKQMICPGLHREINKEDEILSSNTMDCSCSKNLSINQFCDKVYNTCRRCDKYIHVYPIRMGCITPEELFYRIEEQIKIYTDEDPKTGLERRRLHIIIDDLQQIDYGFPFLNDTTLFSAALINLCHEHKVDMTILCDKHATCAKNMCAIADNVLCIDRKKDDIRSATVYVEKCIDIPAPGSMIEFRVNDIMELFECKRLQKIVNSQKNKVSNTCNKEGLVLDMKAIKNNRLIGTMRDYWRKSEKVVVDNYPNTGFYCSNTNEVNIFTPDIIEKDTEDNSLKDSIKEENNHSTDNTVTNVNRGDNETK